VAIQEHSYFNNAIRAVNDLTGVDPKSCAEMVLKRLDQAANNLKETNVAIDGILKSDINPFLRFSITNGRKQLQQQALILAEVRKTAEESFKKGDYRQAILAEPSFEKRTAELLGKTLGNTVEGINADASQLFKTVKDFQSLKAKSGNDWSAKAKLRWYSIELARNLNNLVNGDPSELTTRGDFRRGRDAPEYLNLSVSAVEIKPLVDLVSLGASIPFIRPIAEALFPANQPVALPRTFSQNETSEPKKATQEIGFISKPVPKCGSPEVGEKLKGANSLAGDEVCVPEKEEKDGNTRQANDQRYYFEPIGRMTKEQKLEAFKKLRSRFNNFKVPTQPNNDEDNAWYKRHLGVTYSEIKPSLSNRVTAFPSEENPIKKRVVSALRKKKMTVGENELDFLNPDIILIPVWMNTIDGWGQTVNGKRHGEMIIRLAEHLVSTGILEANAHPPNQPRFAFLEDLEGRLDYKISDNRNSILEGAQCISPANLEKIAKSLRAAYTKALTSAKQEEIGLHVIKALGFLEPFVLEESAIATRPSRAFYPKARPSGGTRQLTSEQLRSEPIDVAFLKLVISEEQRNILNEIHKQLKKDGILTETDNLDCFLRYFDFPSYNRKIPSLATSSDLYMKFIAGDIEKLVSLITDGRVEKDVQQVVDRYLPIMYLYFYGKDKINPKIYTIILGRFLGYENEGMKKLFRAVNVKDMDGFHQVASRPLTYEHRERLTTIMRENPGNNWLFYRVIPDLNFYRVLPGLRSSPSSPKPQQGDEITQLVQEIEPIFQRINQSIRKWNDLGFRSKHTINGGILRSEIDEALKPLLPPSNPRATYGIWADRARKLGCNSYEELQNKFRFVQDLDRLRKAIDAKVLEAIKSRSDIIPNVHGLNIPVLMKRVIDAIKLSPDEAK
jgi:hypothetical protein